MMKKIGYDSWDFENMWKIEEGQTIAYLKNVQKPESVNKENITYEEFDVIGEGTEEAPFIITTAVQLQKISEKLASYYKLGADIDLIGRTWTSIGTSSNPFIGNIDGTGYTISNLSYDNEEGENVGLFGYNSGTISNITLENITIKGKSNVGSLVGYNKGTVTKCTVKGNITGVGNNVGGLIGYNTGSVNNNQIQGIVTGNGSNTGGLIGQTIAGISNNISKIEVHGQAYTGGLVGYVYMNTAKTIILSNNVSEGKVIGGDNTGGLIGSVYQNAPKADGTYQVTVEKSYAIGDVEGKSSVGGLVGYIYGYEPHETVNKGSCVNSYIQESYATGNVKAEGNNIGGLVGYIYGKTAQTYYREPRYINIKIENSFATGKAETTGSNVGGLIGYINRNSIRNGDVYTSVNIQLTNTYAIGEVISEGQAGGLVGTASSAGNGNTTATDSFWNTETTKQETSVLGTAANTTSMMGTELYTNWSSDVWTMEQGQYPKLKF